MIKKKAKFLRIGYSQYSKLGLRRKKLQKYRRARGGENKVRLKMKGHLRNVSSGFRSEKKNRNLIDGLRLVQINNLNDLKNLQKEELGIVAKIGSKKKIEIAKYALEHKIRLHNLNAKKFLDKIENKLKQAKEEKAKRMEKKKIQEKKSKESEKKKDEKKKEEKHETNEKEIGTKEKQNTENETNAKPEENKK